MNFKKLIVTLSLLLCLSTFLFAQNKNLELQSPNGAIKVSLHLSDKIYYTISYSQDELLKDNSLMLHFRNEVLGQNPKLISSKKRTANEVIMPYIPLKYSTVKNNYNSLLLNFKDNYAVEFRAFDEGVAYHFTTMQKGDVEVMHEDFSLHFPDEYNLGILQPRSFRTSYEEPYSTVSSKEWATDKMSTLPLLIDTKKQYKILISESQLSDYPCMFLKSTGDNGITSTFPKVPLEFAEDGDRSLKITKEADYIAKTTGTRDFPWRYLVITTADKQLMENTMTLKLAAPGVIKNPSWIKPGQASWEWWNDASPYGPDVNFVSGYNTATYKYYIDFASKFGLKYIVMDEGWAKTTRDPYTPNPDVDVHEIIRYGKEKNVGVVLWLTWLTVNDHMELFKTFKDWGVKGVKIDFMDRSDQWMVNFYDEFPLHWLRIVFCKPFNIFRFVYCIVISFSNT